VEHIINDSDVAAYHKICRIVDPTLAHSMQKHVLTCVLHFHKQWSFYQAAKQNGQWAKPNPIERPTKVGILGVGELGQAVAKMLQTVGFEVIGFSRKPKEISNLTVWDSENHSLPSFLQEINVLVSLLPRTPQTEGVLSYELLQNLPKGSCLINVGRGAHLVEDDLLKLLKEGIIEQAYLDVFQEEPLSTSHPFWSHPNIFITPHTASITNQENAAKIIADNYQRLKTGAPIRFEVQLDRGY
jgi:glyoxylate/hydroxypyruvate reductase A